MIAARDSAAVAEIHDDRGLMRQIEAGSTVAFEELYDRFSLRAFRVAAAVCRDTANTEEAVQELFVSVWRTRGSYRPERGSVAAWLLTSVRYKAIDIGRRDQAQASHHAAADLIELHPGAENIDNQVAGQADGARLRVLLKRIPDAQREVITLAFYGQLTHVEIAEHLQLPAGTVKGRMRLGLQKLRTQVEQDAA